MGRPLGEVAAALRAEAERRPGTVRELSARARVGYRVARYTASRMLERGELVPVLGSRPAVVVAPACALVCLLPGSVSAEGAGRCRAAQEAWLVRHQAA